MADLKLKVIMDLADKAAGPLRNITRGSKEAAQALKAARDTVKALNDQQRKVDGFQKQQAALKAASTQTKVLQQNVDALTRAHGANTPQVKAAEKALAKATTEFKKQRDAALRLRSELNKAGIGNLAEAQARITRETAAATAQIERQTNRLKAAGGMQRLGLGDNLQRIGDKVSQLRNQAAVGLAAGGYAFKRFFLDVAADFERFEGALTTIEGSSTKAKESMAWVQNFAATTPYQLAEVTEAFIKLKARGFDPKNGALATLGDTASALQLSGGVLQAVEALADAVNGEGERLKEAFNITQSVKGDEITYFYKDLKTGADMSATANKRNRTEIEKTLTTILRGQFGGAMVQQSKTWAGMMSNMADQWTRFTNTVMSAGLFDFMKNKLSGLLATLDRMAANGQLQAWAEKTGAAFMLVAENTWAFFEGIRAVLTRLADFVGGWKNLGIILVALKLLPLVLLLGQLGMALAVGAKLALLFATGTATAGAALGVVGTALASVGRLLLLNPLYLKIAFIAGIALLIYKNWAGISSFFKNMFSEIHLGASFLLTAFTDLGGQMMRGLVYGIGTGASWVRDAIGKAADSAIGYFREKLGIKSPSRVFMAAGHHVGEGAAIGISRSAALVQRASAGLTAAALVPGMAMAGARIDARPPLGAGASSAPTMVQGDTITIHVSAAPGQDPQSLARAIAAELDRRASAKQARARGSLTDIN
ncbi:MAG: hypothetical protein Q7J58_17595 [Hydrogenophaga sp.]|uniref:tape measure protein n=1 Tax=Hydrogenophaga sp. TaxID=1904254 RepID=UPI00271B724A|nr:tape measure protein [Hydrogenophaga sp.]MDO9571167.1 hypothetical protein [Hydrogenophaga sp.]